MVEIPLYRGKGRTGVVVGRAVVDDVDAAKIAQHRWFLHTVSRELSYARRYLPHVNGHSVVVYMHHEVFGRTRLLDHRDRDGLNNTRSNLRPATHAENMQNKRVNYSSISGERGVHRKDGRWCAYLVVGGEKKIYKSYELIEDAIQAVRAARAKFCTHAVD